MKINNALLDIDYIKEQVEDVYSTTEVKTNKRWIDNKPIYRKVVQFNGLSGTSVNNIPLGLTDASEILPTSTVMLYESSGRAYSYNYNNIYNVQIDTGAFFDKSNNRLSIKQYGDFGFTKGYIIVEYTKTTTRKLNSQ